jgi:hypothetical protein
MKSRALGYGGALLLTAIALAILIDTFVRGGNAGGQGPAAGAQQMSGTPDAVTPRSTAPAARRRVHPAPPAAPAEQAPRRNPARAVGATRCSPRSAIYQRSGDTVKVTVDFPGNGYVAAFVELEGRDTVTKSATNTGTPQSFLFTGVPASITRRIGVTVITQVGMQTCDVPPKPAR